MVSEAKSGSESAGEPGAEVDDELADSKFGRILVILGIVALVVAVAILAWGKGSIR